MYISVITEGLLKNISDSLMVVVLSSVINTKTMKCVFAASLLNTQQ